MEKYTGKSDNPFYDVNEGEVLIDGENIINIKLSSYRKLFGLVTQDNILFNDSIRNNISLGKPDATLEEIQAAAKLPMPMIL